MGIVAFATTDEQETRAPGIPGALVIPHISLIKIVL
jgi:hypothetical protein